MIDIGQTRPYSPRPFVNRMPQGAPAPAMNAILHAAPALALRPEFPADAAAIEAVLDAAFGPGRFAKTAERVRERLWARDPSVSRVAIVDGRLVGVCRMGWIGVGAAELLFLGPLAVAPAAQHGGLGAALVEACLVAAADARAPAVLLVGAPGFFAPLGFAQVPPGRIALPGPVAAQKLLWRPLRPGGTDGLAGPLSVSRAARRP